MAENTEYQRIKEITDQLEAGIKNLFESDQYRTWLTTMSRFHDYSLNNTILICQQKPDATLVAGYTAWQKKFGRQVQKAEKAIRILAPAPYKQKREMDKVDPITGEILRNPDGSIQKETKEVLMPAYKVVNVFDVSQTAGKELPSLGVDELTGDVAQFDRFFAALKLACPVPIEYEDIPSGAKGYFSPTENRIALQKNMSQQQTAKTLIHEMAHQKLHSADPKKLDPAEPRLSRNAKEVEAESVAFTVCQHYGIDTSDYSFAYIAGWSHGKDTPELKASMNTIRKASSELINDIDGHLKALTREHEAEKLANEIAVLLSDIRPFPFDKNPDEIAATASHLKQALLENSDSLTSAVTSLQKTVLQSSIPEIPRCREALFSIRAFLGEDHPLSIKLFGKSQEKALTVPTQQDKQRTQYAFKHTSQTNRTPSKPVEKPSVIGALHDNKSANTHPKHYYKQNSKEASR